MKNVLSLLLCAVLCVALLAGCTAGEETSSVVSVDGQTSEDGGAGRYEETYYDLFDTSCTFIAYTDSEAQFNELSEKLHDYLLNLHKLFDIYTDYDGVTNLRALNLAAGTEPLAVDGKILDVLELGKKAYTLSEGQVNITYGAVVSLWDTMRAAAEEDEVYVLPNDDALEKRAAHAKMENLVLDREKGTAFLTDEETEVNAGAIAKGYASQQACDYLRSLGVTSAALNMGGNVCTIGVKKEDGAKWNVGIADPDGNGYVRAVEISDLCVVTSGDYERYYEVEGERYCHLIDPKTNYPARTFRSTTVIGEDAGLCDALSTALFLLPLEKGQALIENIDGVEAFWILADGTTAQSDGFSALLMETSDETDE